MFIIEGPDCAGKSTLCSLLSSVLKLDVIHLNNKSDNSYEAYKKRIEDMVVTPVIYDRFYFSEIVYSKVMDRKCTLSNKEIANLNNSLFDNGIQVIHCTQPLDELLRRAESRGEDFVNKLQHAAVTEDFWRLFSGRNVTLVELNINNFELFMSRISNFADHSHGTKTIN